jgi:hypothetical protein
MDIANFVANYLADANFGTVGTDIFVGQIPNDINGIYVERIGGTLNNYVPIEESVVNVYAKNTSAAACILTLEKLKRHIHRMHSTDDELTYVYTFLVLGDIEDVARDIEYAKVFKITLQVVHRDKSLIS